MTDDPMLRAGRSTPRPWPERLLVRASRVPAVVQDAALAAALFALTFGPGRLAGATGIVLQAALVLPLVWRRRAPLTVFGVITAVACVQGLLGLQLPADAALLVALGTVAARSPWRWAVAAGLVLTAGAVASAARWAPDGRFPAAAGALTAAVTASALIGANVRIRRAARQERVAHLERERDRAARLAAAAERARIARELHDSVTHSLSVVVALADAVVHARPDDATAVQARIAETGRQALTDMRRALGLLQEEGGDEDGDGNGGATDSAGGGGPGGPGGSGGAGPVREPLPGLGELAALCERMRAVGMPTRLTLRRAPAAVPVPAAAQLTTYRIVQESLTNTLNHAPAGTRAEVRVHCLPGAVTVEVTDDGRSAAAGPGGSAPGPRQGRGLTGMRQRAAVYGGVLDAGPLPGGGWRVFTRLDLTDDLTDDLADDDLADDLVDGPV
ncbi:sensor histidine kinase [Streptomyces sp. NPDC090025]|uniref:sensor histidine kinase n=1 Tax=Streptomyces sp. NPDC090025 TaxID=3365922 RepID=UPI00383332C7